MTLNHIFGTRIGRYIDIGSGQPIRGSNTYAFYKKGWVGYLVDPVLANIVASKRIRPRDQAIHALCSDKIGEERFYEFNPYQYSTLSLERATDLRNEGISCIAEYEIKAITLASLELEATPAETYLMCIDVEGWELRILQANNWTKFTPAVICVEEWESPLQQDSQIRGYLSGFGYQLVAFMSMSSIYVHRDSGLL